MVSREEPQAFFGLSPNGLRPKARQIDTSTKPVTIQSSRSIIPARRSSLPKEDFHHENFGKGYDNNYDASSDDYNSPTDLGSHTSPAQKLSNQTSVASNSGRRVSLERSTTSQPSPSLVSVQSSGADDAEKLRVGSQHTQLTCRTKLYLFRPRISLQRFKLKLKTARWQFFEQKFHLKPLNYPNRKRI